ncbi:zonular occludens toxin domain-containing protein [Acinetobacter bohemicus]|uniref:zonular occludens toxin domain-containing protein n=1 Tax=Acinetobacter bohemicus TaxID=1435036 RepID=UPI004042F4E8
MAILITAPVGTGKTLQCMELIFSYLNEGREVFTNIIGLKITGARVVNSTPYYPFDWRDLPDGAVLIWDEAHEHPAFSERDLLKNYKIEYYENELFQAEKLNIPDTKKKALIAQIEKEYAKALRQRKEQIMDIGLSMSMHRQFGMEIILVTQNPTKLNKDVLGNITIHHVMRRKFGFEGANIWTFGEAMTTWGKSVADSALVKKYWRFPKHLYKFYISAEQHNVKKYFPKKYYVYACVPLLIFYLGYAKARETGFMGLVPKADQVEQVKTDPKAETGFEAEIVKLDENSPERLALDKLQAESLGMTLEQYQDLKNPEKRNTEIAVVQKQYDVSNPFDYSYMQPPPVAANRVFSGCLNNVAYDQQGSVIHDAPKDLCTRLIKHGDRPFNPYKQVNNYGSTMVTQNNNPQVDQSATKQNNPTLSPEEMAKYQLAKERGLI